ncbi:MAG: sulfite exporter TauE/SafE family protein [Caldilineaceae bacterium]|nr:sulfite exporter TauE/SafE family protein [Caldilineaceae bacterium]MBP8292317.1 sulfite exporter TauE/SafE family protein [Caldilineaceae bacterium]
MAELLQSQPAGAAVAPGQPQPESVSRWAIFAHAVFFVFGFTLIFTLMGSAAGLLGRNLNRELLELLQKFGAIMLVIFGLATLGVFRWLVGLITARVNLAENPAAEALVGLLEFPNKLLYTEKRVTGMHQVNRKWGYFSSSLLGISFAAGWVPCIGPILASILFLAGDSQTALQGAGLLLIYSLGLGIPFLITGAMFSSISKGLRKLNRYAGIVSIISGFFMLYVAYLLWSDSLAQLTTQFIFLNDWVIGAEDWISATTGAGDNLLAAGGLTMAGLAFFAGIISFFSPCVLPLVPAYIGYLSGAAVGSRPQSS